MANSILKSGLTPNQRLQLEKQLEEIQNERANLRNRERSVKARSQTISSQPLVSSTDLRANLSKIVPKHLLPQNLGNFNDVMWDYWIPFNFDFGLNPTFDSNTKDIQYAQVDQEAGFLLTVITRDSTDPGQSGQYSPLQLTIRDLQSSRQFNDNPIPFQQIGFKALPSYLDTPLYFAANARIQIEVTSWIPRGSTFATTGSGKQQITLGGYRIRNKDAAKVMASIFI